MRAILITIALALAFAAPAQAQDLRSPDARTASPPGGIEIERSIAPGAGGGVDIPPGAIVSIAAFALAGFRFALALQSGRRLA